MAKAGDATVSASIADVLSPEGDIIVTGSFLKDHDCSARDYEYGCAYKEGCGKGRRSCT